MENRSAIVEFYRKTTHIFTGIGRMKKAMRCNWPEPSLYCGCCSLSTGIYIRSVLIIVVTSITLGINGWVLDFLLQIRQGVYSKNLTEIDQFWDPETDIESIYFIYKAIIIYYILWITLKIVYILTVCWTIYAVYRKHTKMLKILIYISIPSVILDFLISVACAMLLDNIIKIVLLMCILSEGYNILALNSEYKKITGKSRAAVVYERELESNTLEYSNIYQRSDLIFRPGYNRAHCRSCTCYENMPENPPDYNSTREVNTAETSAPIVNNIGESSLTSTVVNNLGVSKPNEETSTRNIVQSRYTCSNIVVDVPSNTNYINSYVARPTIGNMSNRSNGTKEVKIELSDNPVIYDERQLDVGTSPVIEDRPINSNN